MSEATDTGKRSATETVLDVLEKFGESEPQHVVVAWLAEDGTVRAVRDSVTSDILTVGLLDLAKLMFMRPQKQDEAE